MFLASLQLHNLPGLAYCKGVEPSDDCCTVLLTSVQLDETLQGLQPAHCPAMQVSSKRQAAAHPLPRSCRKLTRDWQYCNPGRGSGAKQMLAALICVYSYFGTASKDGNCRGRLADPVP